MQRIVEPELLDTLSPEDPRAVRSRLDLRRVNAWMRHPGIMAFALQKGLRGQPPGHITELGAGDGDFLLQVAKKIQAGQAAHPSTASGTKATLVDHQKNVSAKTIEDFTTLGWRAEAVVADVFNWPPMDSDVVIANLFLHHFKNGRLAELFRGISQRTNLFIALEPSRSEWSLFGSHLLWAIGCNEVTRHDAVVSVRAGFAGYELSALWPDKDGWQLSEQSVGMFSQLFIAKRRDLRESPAEKLSFKKLFESL